MQSTACAKIILFGDHSVVYRKPGIAAPVKSLSTTVRIKPSAGMRVLFDRDLEEDDRARIVQLILLAQRELGIDEIEATLEIASTIPFSAGLGSSASLSIALLRALARLKGICLTPEELDTKALTLERRFHGTPSGIDHSVIALEKTLLFQDKKATLLKPGKPMTILIADTGIRGETKETVEQVRRQYRTHRAEMDGILAVMERVATEAATAIRKGLLQETGSLMLQNHTLLKDLGVSCPELDELVKAADEAGAYGAKLSGGGKGGIVIALVPEQKKSLVKRAWERQKVKVYETVIA